LQHTKIEMIANAVVALLLAFFSSATWASDLCPPTDTEKEWSVKCFEGEDNSRRVKGEYINKINANAYGMTKISILDSRGLPREVVAVDRYGQVVISNILHTGDFDYPSAYRGLGRFTALKKDVSGKYVEKCGYFQSPQFRILVPAEFDQCDPFTKDGAYACKDCVSYCSNVDCHVRAFIGGRGFLIGTNGYIKREFIVKTLETYCRRPDLVRLTTTVDGAASIHCDGPSDNPFVM
jgi:hypothetical protein